MTQKGTAAELGTQPIGKLLMQYAIPAIIAMTASSLCMADWKMWNRCGRKVTWK